MDLVLKHLYAYVYIVIIYEYITIKIRAVDKGINS